MDGHIIARKRLISALLLQDQLLFLCILRRKHHPFGKKSEKRFWMQNLFKDREEKAFSQY